MRVRALLEPRAGASYAQLAAYASACETAGFEAFFRSDHLLGAMPDDPYRATEAWSSLAALGRDTERLRLGTLLTPITFRAPAVLANAVATADEASGGRVELGIGAGWYQREHEAYGVRFPAVGERFDLLEEQLAIITGIWAASLDERFDHDGAHYRVEASPGGPEPTQRPHPPIIIGGAGPKRTPRLAAQYADEYNATLLDDQLDERLQRVDEACERIDRDPATIRRSVVVPLVTGSDDAEVRRRHEAIRSEGLRAATRTGSPEQIVDLLAALPGQRIDTVYLHLYDADDLEHVQLLGDQVLPHLAEAVPTT